MLVRTATARPSVPVLLIDQGERRDTVAAYLATKRLISPQVLIDPSQNFGRFAGSSALPTTLFVASDGTIRRNHAGEISRAALDAGIDNLLEIHR
jgi:cytochrome c biogenesis protein CcmG/thiol:disulfide interchange protein DsbE